MRAIFQWLALAPLLVFSGCRTLHSPPPPADSPAALSRAESDRAEALAHYSQALISQTTLGEAQNSLSHYRQAAAHDPSYLPLSLKVAVDYISRHDYTGAVAVLNQAFRHHPDSPEIQLVLGSLYQTQGKTREAIRAFRSAIRLAPERPGGYVRLATLHAVSLDRRNTLAVVDSGLARVKDPELLLDFCENAGRLYLVGKEAGSAALFFERILRRMPGREDIRELMARCHALEGRNREAIAEYQTLLKSHPDNSQLLVGLGELHEEEGEIALARDAFQRAMAGVPPEPMAFIRMAGLLLPDNPVEAIKLLDEATARFPTDVRVRVVLALFYMRVGKYGDAVDQFERVHNVIEKDEDAKRMVHPLFYYWYGGACDRAGRPADAERVMAKYLELNPGAPEALNTLAYLWAEQGRNLDQALEYVGRALLKEPKNGAFLDTLGWIHYKKGNYSLALENLVMALKKEGDDPTILEHVGDAHLALEQKGKALKMWWKSIRIEPGNNALREKMIRHGVEAGTLPPVKGK
jgi:tetratricopeptide (TPR) repeat protein